MSESEMKVYIHDDRSEPCLMIPLSDNLWLVWIRRDNDNFSEWSIKNTEYIKSMREKFPTQTTAEIAVLSEKLTEASGLDLLIHTGQSYKEVEEIFLKHKRAIVRDKTI